MKKLTNYGGVALFMAGFCFAVPNAAILPFVDFSAPFSELLTSTSFFYRMIFAALTVALLLFGTIGIYSYHITVERFKLFRNITFILAFFGSAFMLANEWHQIFVLPEVSTINPKTVNELGSSDHIDKFAIGAMLALTTFSLGWILFSVSLLISKKLKRLGLILVLAGFLMIPLISGVFNPVIGGMSGSVILGIGFIIIGVELIKAKEL